MSEPKAQQEPSMEEILASIRRIISEDGSAEAKPPAATAVAEPEPQDEPEPAAEGADVLELTEVVQEEPVAEEPQAEEKPESAPEPADDEIELREEASEPEPMPVVPPPPAAPAPVAAGDGGLVSPPTAEAATSMLSSLAQAVDASRSGTPIGQGNRTIEDLVKEVMRPMIKDWLDANLPGLVERLVRREIERLSRSAEGDI